MLSIKEGILTEELQKTNSHLKMDMKIQKIEQEERLC